MVSHEPTVWCTFLKVALLCNHDEDVPYAYTAPANSEYSSILHGSNRITNNEYRQFVAVRDSIVNFG